MYIGIPPNNKIPTYQLSGTCYVSSDKSCTSLHIDSFSQPHSNCIRQLLLFLILQMGIQCLETLRHLFAKDQRVGKQHRLDLKLNVFSPKLTFLTTIPCNYQYMWLQIYCFVICFVLVFFFIFSSYLLLNSINTLSLYFPLVLV